MSSRAVYMRAWRLSKYRNLIAIDGIQVRLSFSWRCHILFLRIIFCPFNSGELWFVGIFRLIVAATLHSVPSSTSNCYHFVGFIYWRLLWRLTSLSNYLKRTWKQRKRSHARNLAISACNFVSAKGLGIESAIFQQNTNAKWRWDTAAISHFEEKKLFD